MQRYQRRRMAARIRRRYWQSGRVGAAVRDDCGCAKMMLSEHFSLSEFTTSQEAARSGLRNEPGAEQIGNMRALCEEILEPLRRRVNRPIIISSGYRSHAINARIGGSQASQHMRGEAADILVAGMLPTDVVVLIRALVLPFDQLIDEFGRWVHVSHKRGGPQRGDVLAARRKNGETVYIKRI